MRCLGKSVPDSGKWQAQAQTSQRGHVWQGFGTRGSLELACSERLGKVWRTKRETEQGSGHEGFVKTLRFHCDCDRSPVGMIEVYF